MQPCSCGHGKGLSMTDSNIEKQLTKTNNNIKRKLQKHGSLTNLSLVLLCHWQWPFDVNDKWSRWFLILKTVSGFLRGFDQWLVSLRGCQAYKENPKITFSSSLMKNLKISLLGGWLGRRAQQRHNWILWRIWGKVWKRLDQENLRNICVILPKYILLKNIRSRKFEKYLGFPTKVRLTKEDWIKKIWEILGLSY